MEVTVFLLEYFFELFLALMDALMLIQIKALHLYDCLRANKSTSAWGVEARVPFLDKEFINVAMNIDPEWKMVTYSASVSFLHPPPPQKKEQKRIEKRDSFLPSRKKGVTKE